MSIIIYKIYSFFVRIYFKLGFFFSIFLYNKTANHQEDFLLPLLKVKPKIVYLKLKKKKKLTTFF
jgi:hypothetical protein